MIMKKFKSADDEIQYLQSKKPLTDEEFDRLDTLVADQIGAATDALFAILENLSPMEELRLIQQAISKLGAELK